MSKSKGSGDERDSLLGYEAKQASLAGAGSDPMAGQQAPEGQPDRMAAILARKAELQAEMDRSASEYQAETANNWQFPAQAPAQAGLPAVMPARAPSPEMRTSGAPGAPDIPGVVGMPRTVAEYGIEATRNLPGSLLESLGQGAWEAAQDPVGMAKRSRRDRDRRGAARERILLNIPSE